MKQAIILDHFTSLYDNVKCNKQRSESIEKASEHLRKLLLFQETAPITLIKQLKKRTLMETE